MEPICLVHGGASPIIQERICGKKCGVQDAVKAGYNAMQSGGKAIDAVEAAIRCMESDQYFNAGYGAILNMDGFVEMDASIMDGSDLSAGSIAIVTDVEHPISLARLVKEQSPHVLMAGAGASSFAESNGMCLVPPDAMISDYAKECYQIVKEKGLTTETRELGGTVGCVALDKDGNLAAGTSTGGTNGKLKGRIGDSPIIGAGTYADNSAGAVSCTGHGEAILRRSLAHSIVKDLELGRTPMDALKQEITIIKETICSDVGAICISKQGEVGVYFSGPMMPWSYVKAGVLHDGLYPGEDNCHCFTC